MKTFITALVLSTAVMTAPALAFSLSMDNLTRNLTFPEPVEEPVTKDRTQQNN